PEDPPLPGIAKPLGPLRDPLKHWLHVGRRASDHVQDLARRRLLVKRGGQRAARRFLPLQALRQALLQIVTLGGFVLRQRAGAWLLGDDLCLPGLGPPTHLALLTSQRRYDCAATERRLR